MAPRVCPAVGPRPGRKRGALPRRTLPALLLALTLTLTGAAGGARGYAPEEPRTLPVTLQEGEQSAWDNYCALEDALSAADGETPLTVQVANDGGSYYLSATLRIRSGTTLDLNGAELIRWGDTMANLLNNVSPGGTLYDGRKYGMSHDIEVRNGTLNGLGGDPEKICNLAVIGHASGVTFSHVNFRNCRGTHLLELNGCRDCLVDSCTFSGFIIPDDFPNHISKEALQLDVSYNLPELRSEESTGAGLGDGTFCENVTVQNCDFLDYPSGVGNHYAVYSHHNRNIRILNNRFRNTKAYPLDSAPAINCLCFEDTLVSGNVITGRYTDAIQVRGGSVTVQDNDLGSAEQPLTYPALAVNQWTSYRMSTGAADTPEKVTGGAITDNRIYTACRTEKAGVYIGGRSALSAVSGNTIRSKYTNALTVTGASVGTCADNTLTASSGMGLHVASQGRVTTVSGNTIHAKSTGLHISSSAVNTVRKNRITSTAERGLHLSRAQNLPAGSVGTLSSNTITSPGIALSVSGAKATTISGNTLTSRKDVGLRMTSGAAVGTISGNTVTAKQNGVHVSAGTLTGLKNNRITSQANGFQATSAAKVSAVRGNRITARAGGVLISAKSRVTTAADNRITATGSGVKLTSGGQIKYLGTSSAGNTVTSSSAEGGIRISKSTAGTIAGNKVTAKKGAGVSLSAARVTAIDANQVKDSRDCAIRVTGGSKVTKQIARNSISRCGSSGIYVGGGSSVKRVTANTVRSCTASGIHAVSTATLTKVQSNVVTDCEAYGICILNPKAKVNVTKNTLKRNGAPLRVNAKGTHQTK